MAKSLDFLNNITLNLDKTAFSARAKAQGLDVATENLCKALAKILDTSKNLNEYERADANCATYDGLYGADEVCYNLKPENRRKRKGYSSTNYYTNSGGFYLTAYQIATKMWGFDTAELPTSQYSGSTSSVNGTTSTYQNNIDRLEVLGCVVDSYWKIDRFLPAGETTANITPSDPNSFFDGALLRFGSSQNSYRVQYPCGLFAALIHHRAHYKILRTLIEQTPTTRGGKGGVVFNDNYSTRDTLYSFTTVQPHDLVRIRQALTEVRAGYAASGYDIYNPGTATNSITSGRIGSRIKKALSNRGITFASAEISDKTLDVSNYYIRATRINDPLIITAAGFANVEQQSSHESTGGGWWSSLVPAVHICRKYLMRRYAVAYDYKEETNPNAYEKDGGKVSYRKSNIYVWQNSRCTSATSWRINTHDYDAYYATGQYTYLNSISDVLRANIAKTNLGINRGEQLSDITNAWGYALRRDHWAFLPTLTMFGVANRSSTRRWSNGNIQCAVDDSNYIDDSDGETYIGGGYEAELGGESVTYEEVAESIDLIENAWELGNRKYQFKVNPECNDASTARTDLYIPTNTPAVNKADSKDGTVPNRIACFYLPKADGTATTSQMGTSSPYNYNPTTHAFALVPFHTATTDDTCLEWVTEPVMSYSATAYEDL